MIWIHTEYTNDLHQWMTRQTLVLSIQGLCANLDDVKTYMMPSMCQHIRCERWLFPFSSHSPSLPITFSTLITPPKTHPFLSRLLHFLCSLSTLLSIDYYSSFKCPSLVPLYSAVGVFPVLHCVVLLLFCSACDNSSKRLHIQKWILHVHGLCVNEWKHRRCGNMNFTFMADFHQK